MLLRQVRPRRQDVPLVQVFSLNVSAQFAKDVHKAAQFTLAAFVEGSEDLDLVEGCLGSV